MTNTKRVVVFDLDETLGYFTEFGVFYELLCKYKNIPSQQRQFVFNKLLSYLTPSVPIDATGILFSLNICYF